ncbi:MAG: sulfatase-like hydrolase/transferase [Rikenellaceae bacterium]
MKNILLTTTILSAGALTAAAAPKSKPNVIFIMADDLGWGDVGFNGNKVIQTPNLDALASEGIIFDRFYAACAVSSPTRNSVLTGRNPYRTGIFHANVGIMRQEEITLPELLKCEEYTTGHFGKWHLGSLTDKEKDANRGKVGNSVEVNPPSLHGYDDSFVTESKVPTYDPMIAPVAKKGSFWDYVKEGEESKAYGTAYWNHDGSKATENLSGDDSRVIMDRVLPFIEGAKAKNSPFMSVVWFHAPHLPCVAGPEHQELYKDYPLDKRNYYGCITALDEQVGRLVDYLKANDLFDNTLIFFCSDNGPEGNDSAPGVTSGLRGRKRSLYEGGIRVPAFVVWGDKIKPQGRIETPCFTSDYMPTILDILGIGKNNTHQLDGQSIIPMVAGRKLSAERKHPMVFVFGDQAAVVDNKYKLYYLKSKNEFELYDITLDRGETNNIASANSALVEKYKEVLVDHLQKYKCSFLGEEFPVNMLFSQEWITPLAE